MTTNAALEKKSSQRYAQQRYILLQNSQAKRHKSNVYYNKEKIMTLDQAHKIVLSYADAVGNDDWKTAIARIEEAQVEAAFNAAYNEDSTVSRGNALYYFNEGRKYATN
jgi:hypothetical protein